MTDQDDRATPSSNEQNNPVPQSPSSPQPQDRIGANPQSCARSDDAASKELAREFRWVEWAQVIINGGLAVIGVIALCIYHGQLTTMQGQLTEMQGSGRQTDQLIGLYQKQLTELQKQATNTQTLAGAANNQVTKLQAGVHQTARLATTAETSLSIQTRPWVDISEFKLMSEKVDANATNFGKTWEFGVSLANYGNSPARRILVSMEAIQETTQYVDNSEKSWKDIRNCVNMESESRAPNGQSTTVFPHQSDIPVPPQSVNISNTINRVDRTPEIVVCIVYLGIGTDIHHTKLLYKPITSSESVPVPNFPKRHYFPVIRYEISDTEAD